MNFQSMLVLFRLLLFGFVLVEGGQHVKVKPGFYMLSCPDAERTVTSVLSKAMRLNSRIAASVLRLQFHDCFVNGCDASLLLDDNSTFIGEKMALSNIASLRPEAFDLVDEIKDALEAICPSTVSCADILIMAARDAVFLSGGPYWEVLLGRRDSLSASKEDSDEIMPSPRSELSSLIKLFRRFNMTAEDVVALSGTHSIGKARCFSITHRLYNQTGTGQGDPTIEEGYRHYLERLCPKGGDENVTASLDATPTVFDNQYFKDLVMGRGFLNSDEVLFTSTDVPGGKECRDLVLLFSFDQNAFFSSLVNSMIKLGNLLPPAHHYGEIRKNCRRANSIHGSFGSPVEAQQMSP